MEFELDLDRVRLGRSESSDIVVPVPQVSSLHLELRREGEGYRLVDCQSTNGTRVNGKDVDEVVLADGDEILIGNVVAATYGVRQGTGVTVTGPPTARPVPAGGPIPVSAPKKPGPSIAVPGAKPANPGAATVVVKRAGSPNLPPARPPIKIAKPMPPAARKPGDS